LGAGLGIFAAEECDVVLIGGITLGTQRGYAVEQRMVAELSRKSGFAGEHGDEGYHASDKTFKNPHGDCDGL
jgi:hypothetical protein